MDGWFCIEGPRSLLLWEHSISKTQMVEDPADTFRRRGHAVVSGGLSSTVLGLSPLCCAFWVPIVFTNIQVPPTDHILSALCCLSRLVPFEGCNCSFFFFYVYFSAGREEKGRGGAEMAVKYSLRVWVGVSWKSVPGV